MCLKCFLKADALFRQGYGHILKELVSRIHLNMSSRHGYLNTCETVGGADKKV